MVPNGTTLLGRREVTSLLALSDYVDIVDLAYSERARGHTLETGLLHIDTRDGEFHIKSGGMESKRTYVGLKVNAGFFNNMERFGLPNIQGTILLADGDNGYPLAIMDSMAITVMRTGATTAVAARHLARADSHVATICGCGTQGGIQLRALREVLPITDVYAFDANSECAERFATTTRDELGLETRPVSDLAEALSTSDVCVTCTPSHEHYLSAEHVRPGTFISAVGADSPQKQELEPALLAASRVVVDVLEQCAEVGELHHALDAGLMTASDVHAELGDILVGEKVGRTTADEVFVFDQTGTGLQDAAAVAKIYEKAVEDGVGQVFDFFA